MSASNEYSEIDPYNLLVDLRHRANNLLAEFQAYQTLLRTHNKSKEVEVRTFKRGIESEVKVLNSAHHSIKNINLTEFELEELESKRLHALRSSNLPFYEAVWTAAQQSGQIIALGKRVYVREKPTFPGPKHVESSNSKHAPKEREQKKGAVVDIVGKDGLEWIKVSTITEKRLVLEMAKEGWEGYGGEDDSSSDDVVEGSERLPNPRRNDDENQLELVKLARIIYNASRQSRVLFKHPAVKFVLPKIHEGLLDDVDAVVQDIRSIGIKVICSSNASDADNLSSGLSHLTIDSNPDTTSRMIAKLLPSSTLTSTPTATINIDCTILLALISDISHVPSSSLPPHPSNISGHYHKAITRQIASEQNFPILPLELYPILLGRDLVCTADAAQRMRDIVATMGTDEERERARILLGEELYTMSTSADLRIAMRKVSCHDVPSDLRLPMRVVEMDLDSGNSSAASNCSAADIRAMRKVSERMALSVINRSVFLYGWAQGIVTVTSNRVVALGLVKCIDEILDEKETERDIDEDGETREYVNDDFIGPKLYVCETARSLIGKEKPGGHNWIPGWKGKD